MIPGCQWITSSVNSDTVEPTNNLYFATKSLPLRSLEIDVPSDVPGDVPGDVPRDVPPEHFAGYDRPEHAPGDSPTEHAPGDDPPELVPGDDPPEQNNNQIHPVQPKAFVCENCGKSYSKAHKLKEHRISHKPMPCKYCDKHFKSYSGLRDHLTSVHENSKFICLTCQKQFTTVKALQFHQHKNTCQRELIKNKKCTKCHLKFKNDKTMKQHMSLKHIEDEEI